jgi:hypothetical protein
MNRWRNNTWICLVFYFSMLWIITWPFLFFTTKKYTVVKVDWPFSKKNLNGQVEYATMSEDQWFQRWATHLKKAVMERRQGGLTEEDLSRSRESGQIPQTGNPSVDSAIGFVNSGMQVFQEVNRQVGWGYDTGD